MLVTQETIDAIYEAIKQSFQLNRDLDRICSLLNVKFACNNTSKLIHLDMAHKAPLLADALAETLEAWNIPVVYGETTIGDQEYDSVEDILTRVKELWVDYQTLLMGLIKVSYDNGDLQVMVEVQDILKDANKIVAQAILLVDKVDLYKGNVASFDAHIEQHFWTLG